MGCVENQNGRKWGYLPNAIVMDLSENTSELYENTLLHNCDHHKLLKSTIYRSQM